MRFSRTSDNPNRGFTTSRFLVVSLIIVALGTGTGLALSLLKADGGVAFWKICRNEKAGYEFKYPADWFVYGDGSRNPVSPGLVKETNCEGLLVTVASERLTPENTSRSKNTMVFGISIYDQERFRGTVFDSVKSLDDYTRRLSSSTQQRLKDGVVGGERAAWWNIHGFQEWHIFHDGRMFHLRERNIPPKVFDAIVSSLRFFR